MSFTGRMISNLDNKSNFQKFNFITRILSDFSSLIDLQKVLGLSVAEAV